MKRFAFLAVVIAFGVWPANRLFAQGVGSPAAPDDLVQQVQAADLLADLLTYTVDRADVRVNDAQAYLSKIGKAQAYAMAKPNPELPRPLNYMLLFRGSLAFVEGDGAKYADQSVKDQPTSQLYQDLTADQYYNMAEFLHFNEQRQAFASLQAYLKSIGQYEAFLTSTGGQVQASEASAGASSGQSAPTTPEEVAHRMGSLISFIYDTAWKQAQAKGMSRADFDKQWPAQVKQYRESVMARIEDTQPTASSASGGGFGKAEIAGTPVPPASQPAQAAGVATPPRVVYVGPQQNTGADRPLPAPVQSPYSNAEYRARDMSLWNMWDSNRRY